LGRRYVYQKRKVIGVRLLKLAIINSLLCVLLGQATASLAEGQATYTEFLPGVPPNCERPILNTSGVGTSLDECEAMYRQHDFAEGICEIKARIKRRIALHMLEQYDAQWLANIANRQEACIDLLAEKGRLGLLNELRRWWHILR
jgi:hypothetical protein